MNETSHPQTEPEAAVLDEETARRLKRQATTLRRATAGQSVSWLEVRYSGWQKAVVVLTIFSILGVTILLLSSAPVRHALVSVVVGEWSRLYQTDEQAGLFRLPPPPPKRVQARTVIEQPFIIEAESGVQQPVGEETAAPGPRPFVPPPKTPGSGAAYQLLLSKSQAASLLQQGQLEGLEFRDWNPVQNNPPVYFIALVAFSSVEQREISFTWQVDVQASEVVARSQVARDLEARVARQGS